jgi:hypothetical protein
MGKSITYVSRSFAGKVVLDSYGKKKVAINAPEYYAAEVAKFSLGDELSIVLTNRRPKRTEAQNNYWWGVYLPAIIREGKGSGTAMETHEELARTFLTVKEWRNGQGQLCYIRKSTAELTVGAFCQFIVDVQELTGVPAPPTENFGLAPLSEAKKKNVQTHDTGGGADAGEGDDAGTGGGGPGVPDQGRERAGERGGGRATPAARAIRKKGSRPKKRKTQK